MPSARQWCSVRYVLGVLAVAMSVGCSHPEGMGLEGSTSTSAWQRDHDDHVADDVVAIMAGIVFARASRAEQQQYIITIPLESCGIGPVKACGEGQRQPSR
jgi:hypothetical protein